MAYVPNPADSTQPTDGVIAETAAPEFRALKAYIASLIGLPNSTNLFRKNKIVNGRMIFDQLNEGTVTGNIAASTVYNADYFHGFGTAAAGTFTLQRLSTGIAGASSLNFLRAKVTTIDAAPAAASRYAIRTVIEGVDCQELFWGTAGAKNIVLSFIAQSSVAGTYNFSFGNNALTRTYVGSFVIAAANTPQYFTFSIPGDVAGVWATDNTAGVYLIFSLGTGATWNGVAGWQAGSFETIVGSTNLMATINATLDITDIQFEVGGAASPIEIIPFADELLRVQRRFAKTFAAGTAVAQNAGVANAASQFSLSANASLEWVFPTVMRVAPTVVTFNPSAANANFRDITGAADVAVTVNGDGALSTRKVLLSTAASTVSHFLAIHATARADF